MSSAVGEVQEALYEAITGDATLAGMLAFKKVYSGAAEKRDQDGNDVVPPYIVLGSSAERNRSLFGASGKQGTENILIHTRRTDPRELVSKTEVTAIYNELSRVLDRQTLPLDGHQMLSGRLALVAIYVEPDGETVTAAATYTPHTIATA